MVNPSHYDVMNERAIVIIAKSMTMDMFYGFCLGNVLKYRLRAGKKDPVDQDLAKANYYEALFEKYKHLCCTVDSGS
ncbi:MAG: DUF3310 domain-containing protein [Bacteroides thetaiotaomicron]